MMKFFVICCLFLLSGCHISEQLSTLGKPPALTHIQDPTTLPGYQPVSMPLPRPVNDDPKENAKNSLWQDGSKAFFKDQRAKRVGDILTVMIDFNQQQQIQMTPNIQRSSSSSTTITNLMGLERQAENLFSKKQHEPGKANPSWLDLKSNPSLTGKAQYQVNDQMKFSLATYVIQILPNGNMVIQGRQEARLVNELREIEVKGIVRPEDITSNNTIAGHKVAELRVSYGGRGELTDAQSAPIGQQLLNKVMPF